MAPPRWRETDVWAQVAFYTGLGFIIPGATLAGYAAGWLLDKLLRTSPAFALVGIVAGVAGGIAELLKILNRKEKNDTQRPSGGSGPHE